MAKRKHEEVEDAGESSKQVDHRKQRRILFALGEGTKKLAQAFKLAKGFERQKLGRRRKDAEKEKDYRDMRRIDEEIAAVKKIEVNAAAKQYLIKNLLKIKAVTIHPQLPAEISKPAAPVTDPAILNVIARICNSNPVKKAFPAAINEIKSELDVETDVPQPATKKKRLRAKDYEEAEDASSASADDTAKILKKALSRKKSGGEDDGSISGEDDDALEDEDEDEDEDDEMDQYRSMLASTDDEDGDLGSDVDDLEDLERQLEMEGIARKQPAKKGTSKTPTYDLAADLSLSEDESEAESISSEPRKGAKAVAPIKKSAFVPSLTLGGYVSGSGSDIDEKIDVAPRKNRRGQRARQQIWEKKFGQKAKHLEKAEQNARWDPKRGATIRNARGGRGPMGRGGAGGFGGGRGGSRGSAANAIEVAKRPPRRDDSGPLHPSWVAAKKAKEQKSVPVAFAGKKISFD